MIGPCWHHMADGVYFCILHTNFSVSFVHERFHCNHFALQTCFNAVGFGCSMEIAPFKPCLIPSPVFIMKCNVFAIQMRSICYYHQDLHQRQFDPGSRLRLQLYRCALLHVGPASLARRPGVGVTLEHHPFSGLVDSAGELQTP